MPLFIRCELMCDLRFEQNLECVLRDLVTENADLQSRNQTKDRELAEAQQQLREKVSFYLSRHCNTNVSNLQETQMANDLEIHCRLQHQLREKVEYRTKYTSKHPLIPNCRRNSYNPVRQRR